MAITAPWRNADDIIRVKDLRNTDYASYETLLATHFPPTAVDYSVLMLLPPKGQDDGPVLMVQINFIKGGMVWGIAFDHAYTDGRGAAFVPKVWAAYCRGEDGSTLVTPEIMQRHRLMHGSKTGRLEDYPILQYRPEAEISRTDVQERATSGISASFKIVQTLRSVVSSFGSSLWILLRLLNRHGAQMYPRADTAVPSAQDDDVVGEIFFFSRDKLSELKKLASTPAHWISTNDALASLFYCCITDINKAKFNPNFRDTTNEAIRARWIEKLAVLGSQETAEPFASLAYATNSRKHFEPPLSPDYIGNVTVWNAIAAPLSTVALSPQSVAEFAYHLRRKMQMCNPTFLSDFIGALESVPDISRLGFTLGPYPEFTVVVNSWAGFNWPDIDWGSVVGGKCERLRFETLKVPGVCLVLPEIGSDSRCESGEGLEVFVALKQSCMDMLKEKELFMSFAEWRSK